MAAADNFIRRGSQDPFLGQSKGPANGDKGGSGNASGHVSSTFPTVSSFAIDLNEVLATSPFAPSNETSAKAMTTKALGYSLTAVVWGSAVGGGCVSPAQTIAISCSSGGTIEIKSTIGSPSCRYTATNQLSCTNYRYNPSTVNVWCTGSLGVVATLPAKTFGGCRRSSAAKDALQYIFMDQICQSGGVIYSRRSRSCRLGPFLFSDGSSSYCYTRGTSCVASTSTTCTISTGSVSVVSPSVCTLY